ncbi:MAG: LysR family substrate-binding domain-containing protein, partial [Solirubrobacterales bacterium]
PLPPSLLPPPPPELQAGRLDLGIVRPPIDAQGLATETLLTEELVAVVPELSSLGKRTITAEDLAGEPLVMLAREVVPGLYDQILELRRTQAAGGPIAQEATSIQAVLGLVAAGLGIAVLPGSVQGLSREGIAFAAIRPSQPTMMVAAWRRDASSALIDAFLAAVRSADGR